MADEKEGEGREEEKEGGKKGGGGGEGLRAARRVHLTCERQGASAASERAGRGRAQRDLSWRMRKKERGGGRERVGKKSRRDERDCAPRGARISHASTASNKVRAQRAIRCERSETERRKRSSAV
jgi:hypothetical protein